MIYVLNTLPVIFLGYTNKFEIVNMAVNIKCLTQLAALKGAAKKPGKRQLMPKD